MANDEQTTIESFTRQQFGLIAVRQALTVLSPSALRHRLNAGTLERMESRVLRVTGVHDSWSQSAMSKVLQLPAGSVLSHATAGYLWGLEGRGLRADQRPTTLDLTSPVRARDLPGCRIHHTRACIPTATRNQLPVTTLPRTLVDLSDVLTPANLEKALDSARRKHKTFDTEFTGYLSALRHAGRRRLSLLIDLFRQRTQPLDSSLEVDVVRVLRAEKFPMPTHGYSVYDEQGRYVMKVDHAWVDLKVALHDDSFEHHGHRAAFERDAKQRTILDGLGWKNVIVTHRSLHESHWKDALRKHLNRQSALHFPPMRGVK